MPNVYPFRGLEYRTKDGDVSRLVAPPYDVLDADAKARLLGKDAHNIVVVDLPYTPAKEAGPPEGYEQSARILRNWRTSGVMSAGPRPLLYAYRQTFASGGGRTQRTGMACCVEALGFGAREGGGILPHEETFSGPKEDRLALMKSTRAQLSPIFGLHADEDGAATKLLGEIVTSRGPDVRADMGDGVLHEVWRVEDEGTQRRYAQALAGEDVFIADGHHRYNTALNYLSWLESQGAVGADHPARRVMMVLVGMSDPGLAIWPTHRVLGGMAGYTFDDFLRAAGSHIKSEPVGGGLEALGRALEERADLGDRRLALFDFATGRGCVAAPAEKDPLAKRFPKKPKAWRDLVVAFVQHVLVEQVCQGKLSVGSGVKWAFPHTLAEVASIGRGIETGSGGGKLFGSTGPQLAVLVRPTPLEAVKEIGRAGELMPQKSTFFYPKLATGLFVNALE